MDLKNILESAITSLSSNCSIETMMLQAQTIAHILKDETFKSWVSCEQNGYNVDDKLPSYRIICCQVKVDIGQPFRGMVKNYSFPPGLLGKYDDQLFQMCFHNPIAEIERLSISDGPLKSEIIAAFYPKMNEYINGDILNARQIVSSANLTSIISTVKSKLLSFFLQLNEELDIDIDLTKLENKKTVSNIMNQTFYAGVVNTGTGNIDVNNSNIIGGKNNNITISDDLRSDILSLLQEIKSVTITNASDKHDADESIAVIQGEIDNVNSNSGIIRRALRVLKSIPSIVAVHGIEIGMDKVLSMLSL